MSATATKPLRFRWHVLLFLFIFSVEAYLTIRGEGDVPPLSTDAVEMHNIAWNLTSGNGYSFDWDNEAWRAQWEAGNADGSFDFVMARRGQHPTMFRPPLMPVLVAGIVRLFPDDSFLAWRIFDSGTFAVAACLLCDAAFAGGGWIGMGVILFFLLVDPLRRMFIPGWLTEGLAFDLLSLIVWLIARRLAISPFILQLCGGLAVGLLCLDRPIFLPIVPFICVAIVAARETGRTAMLRGALVVFAFALAVQTPWWIRNCVVSASLMPLGTAGGYNLPDEYGDGAMLTDGEWTGDGIRDAWISHAAAGRPILLPDGYTDQSFRKLLPPWRSDIRFAVLAYANLCVSLESEVEVSHVGEHAAGAWIRRNYFKIPQLMLMKVATLVRGKWWYLVTGLLLPCAAFFLQPPSRRTIVCMGGLTVGYVLAVSLTHVVVLRFLIPLLPPLYLTAAWGAAALAHQLSLWRQA